MYFTREKDYDQNRFFETYFKLSIELSTNYYNYGEEVLHFKKGKCYIDSKFQRFKYKLCSSIKITEHNSKILALLTSDADSGDCQFFYNQTCFALLRAYFWKLQVFNMLIIWYQTYSILLEWLFKIHCLVICRESISTFNPLCPNVRSFSLLNRYTSRSTVFREKLKIHFLCRKDKDYFCT